MGERKRGWVDGEYGDDRIVRVRVVGSLNIFYCPKNMGLGENHRTVASH
jgi:hypothetical protein